MTASPVLCCPVPPPISGDDRGEDHGEDRGEDRGEDCDGGHGGDVPEGGPERDVRGVHDVLQVPEPERGVHDALQVPERLRVPHDKDCLTSVAGQSRWNLLIP